MDDFDESLIDDDFLSALKAEADVVRESMEDFELPFEDVPERQSNPLEVNQDVLNYDKLTGTEELLDDLKNNALVVRLAILARHIRKDPTSWHLYQTQVMLGLDEEIEKTMGTPSVFQNFPGAGATDDYDAVAISALKEMSKIQEDIKKTSTTPSSTIDKVVSMLPNAAPHVHPNVLHRDKIFNVFGEITPMDLQNYAGVYKLQIMEKPDNLNLAYAHDTGTLTLDTCVTKPMHFKQLKYDDLKNHPSWQKLTVGIAKLYSALLMNKYYHIVFKIPSSDSSRFREFMTSKSWPYLRNVIKKNNKPLTEHLFFRLDFDVILKKKLFLGDMALFRKDVRRCYASTVYDYLLTVPVNLVNILNWFSGKNIDGTALCTNYQDRFFKKNLLPDTASYTTEKFCNMGGGQKCGCFACPRELFLSLDIKTQYIFDKKKEDEENPPRLILCGTGKQCIICGKNYTTKYCDGLQHQKMVDSYRKSLERSYGCVITKSNPASDCAKCPLRIYIDKDATCGIALISSNEIVVSTEFDALTSLWLSIVDEYDVIYYTKKDKDSFYDFKRRYWDSLVNRSINFVEFIPRAHSFGGVCQKPRCEKISKLLEYKNAADLLQNDIALSHFQENFQRATVDPNAPAVFKIGGKIYSDYINMTSRRIEATGAVSNEEENLVIPNNTFKRLASTLNETDDPDYDPLEDLKPFSEIGLVQEKKKKK